MKTWNVADVRLTGDYKRDIESLAKKISEMNMQLRVLVAKKDIKGE